MTADSPRQIFTDRVDFGQIDGEYGHHQNQQHHEADLQDALFDPQAEIAAGEALECYDRHMAAIEKRYRKEIQDAEVQAEKGHEHEELPCAASRGLAGGDADPYRP